MLKQFRRAVSLETPVAVHISYQGLVKRISTGALLFALAFIFVGSPALLIGALAVVVMEILTSIVLRAMPEEARPVPFRQAILLWLMQSVSVPIYLIPAIVLIASDDTALALGGFTYLFGVSVHLSNLYSRLPVYNWALLGNVFAIMLAGVAICALDAGPEGDVVHWLVLAGLMMMFIVNTIQTMREHEDVAAAIKDQRSRAETRLVELETMSRHDPLTGLLNRRAFDGALADLWDSNTPREEIAVFMLDLDGFKPINDTHGHEAGDALLRGIASRLSDIPGASLVGRLGGDEFVVAARGIASKVHASALAQRLIEAVQHPTSYGQTTLEVGVSVGIALGEPDTDTPSQLCAQADSAMMASKGQEGLNAIIYRRGLRSPSLVERDRSTFEAALSGGAIRAGYRIYDALAPDRAAAIHAGMTWPDNSDAARRGEGGVTGLARTFGLQIELTCTLLRQVERDIAAWHAAGRDCENLTLSLPEACLTTTHGRQSVERIVDANPDLHRRAIFLVDERLFTARSTALIRSTLNHLSGKGYRIGLDHFAEGERSVPRLTQNPVAMIQLRAKTFAWSAVAPEEPPPGLTHLLGLARAINVPTSLVDAPSDAHIAALRKLGCDYATGPSTQTETEAVEITALLPPLALTMQPSDDPAQIAS